MKVFFVWVKWNAPAACVSGFIATFSVAAEIFSSASVIPGTIRRCVVWLFCGCDAMGWRRSVGSIKGLVSFAEYRLFYRALLQKRLIISRSLLTEVLPGIIHMGVIWLVCRCDVTHSCVTCLSNVCVKRPGEGFRDSWAHSYVCEMTHSWVWCGSSICVICVTWLIHICDMAHPYVRHDSWTYAWYDSFIRVTWLILMFDMTYA